MWHLTCYMLWGVNNLSKFHLSCFYGLWFMIFWRSGGKGSLNDLLTQSIMKVFVEHLGYNGFVKNIQQITNPKQIKKNTWKLPPNYLKTFGIDSTPTPFFLNKNSNRKTPKKLHSIFYYSGWTLLHFAKWPKWSIFL